MQDSTEFLWGEVALVSIHQETILADLWQVGEKRARQNQDLRMPRAVHSMATDIFLFPLVFDLCRKKSVGWFSVAIDKSGEVVE